MLDVNRMREVGDIELVAYTTFSVVFASMHHLKCVLFLDRKNYKKEERKSHKFVDLL